jgi:hypothetical protein
MVYSSAFRTATQLTAAARAAAELTAESYQLSSWLPARDNFGLSFNFDINALSLNEAATYRAFDTEAPFGSTPGAQSRAGKLPPISRKLRVTEFDQLSLYGQTDAIGQKFEDYAERLGGQIAARVALAQGQAVETGTIVLNENKLSFTIDFGRASGHTVTAAAVWSLTATDALTDLLTYKAVYVATNGFPPAVAMMSTSIMSALQKNTSIIKAFWGRGTDVSGIISIDQVRSVFASFGLGRIVINDDQVKVGASSTRLISADKLIFLPEEGGIQLGGAGGALGGTDWGIPAEAINPTYGITDADKSGVFSAAFHDDDPEGHNVLASAIVLPVLESANATFAADVL